MRSPSTWSWIVLMAGLPAQTVRIVDASTGGPGALQAAVNASAAGDILRVRPGSYARTTVTIALHLLAEPRATCEQLVVQGIAAGQTLSVVGFDLVGIPGTNNSEPDAPLRVEACSGKTVLASCTVRGRQDVSTSPFPMHRAAVHVEGAELHCIGTQITGVRGRNSSSSSTFCPGNDVYFLPGPAVYVVGGRVTLSGCTLTGGDGGGTMTFNNCIVQCMTGLSGMPAVTASSALVTVDRSLLVGGRGADLVRVSCTYPGCLQPERGGDGAAAVQLGNSSELVCAGTTTLRAGLNGLSACPTTGASAVGGFSGHVWLDPQTVQLVPGPGGVPVTPVLTLTQVALPSLEVPASRAGIGTPVQWTHRSGPGTFLFWLLAIDPVGVVPHPAVLGGLDALPVPGLTQGPWVVPGTGQVTFGFGIPGDPLLRGARLFQQTVAVDTLLVAASTPLTALFVDF